MTKVTKVTRTQFGNLTGAREARRAQVPISQAGSLLKLLLPPLHAHRGRSTTARARGGKTHLEERADRGM